MTDHPAIMRLSRSGGGASPPRVATAEAAREIAGASIDLVFHVHFSTNASLGLVEIWVNGAPQTF
jgi:hypothetical protein